MGDDDTDSQMMREQQNKDMPQTISRDETHREPTASDSDPQSQAAREAAKAGDVQYANEQMDDVFNQNKRAGGSAGEDKLLTDRATDGAASLVQPGRSRLGR